MGRLMQTAKKQLRRLAAWEQSRGGNLLAAMEILSVSLCVMIAVMGAYQTAFLPAETVPAGLTVSEEQPMADPAVEQLAAFLAAEATDKPYLVKLAIGAVVKNRLVHPLFPNTVAEVLWGMKLAGAASATVTPTDRDRMAATAALYGSDPTGGALYYADRARDVPRTAQITGRFYGVVFFRGTE